MAKPNCKLCGGTGWTVAERDGVSGAQRCDCVRPGSDELDDQAQIPRNYRPAFFETFQRGENVVAKEQLERVVTLVAGYAREYPHLPKPGLLLVGHPGTGKTHLAVAALRELLSRGHEGIFFDYQNLLEQIRSGYDETLGTSRREAYRTALETEVLLLDDLGSHRVTEWVQDTITSIITYRYNHKKALIATTNLPDPKVTGTNDSVRATLQDRIGERAHSRLFEMCLVVRMPAVEDYRMKKAQIR
jgi:DNA replication protein DnaC